MWVCFPFLWNLCNYLCRDLPSTPEHVRTAERERSRLRRLDMTGTDEHRNSRSRSGTPTPGGTPVPRPMFQPSVVIDGGHRHLLAPIPNTPLYGDDPFRMNAPTEAQHVVNLNDDDDMPQMRMPAGWNTVQGGAGPLSQEGQQFEWELPPAIPNPDSPPVLQPSPLPVPQPNPQPVLQQNPLAQPPAQIVAGAR
jgi:hypothetical protein